MNILAKNLYFFPSNQNVVSAIFPIFAALSALVALRATHVFKENSTEEIAAAPKFLRFCA